MMDNSQFSDLLSNTASEVYGLRPITEPAFIISLSSLLLSSAQTLLPPADHSKVRCTCHNRLTGQYPSFCSTYLRISACLGNRTCSLGEVIELSSLFYAQALCWPVVDMDAQVLVLTLYINIMPQNRCGSCNCPLSSLTLLSFSSNVFILHYIRVLKCYSLVTEKLVTQHFQNNHCPDNWLLITQMIIFLFFSCVNITEHSLQISKSDSFPNWKPFHFPINTWW